MPLLLPHGCHTGKISVHPQNWEESTDVAVEWYIHYRFHDPNYIQKYPKGYLAKARGMNDEKDIAERRHITRRLLENEKRNLLKGYNPILRRIVEANDLEISPSSSFTTALEKAHGLLPDTKTKKEVRKALVHIIAAIRQLRYERLQISEVRRRHVKALLTKISQNKTESSGKEWGVSSYNHYRSYLIMLFDQLQEVEATEVDPVSKIKKKRTTKKIRRILTAEEVERIDARVWADQYTLWRFIHIFFHSAARMSEMMLVQRKHVDLPRQRFLVTVRKGSGEIEEVWKTITKAALPLWEEVMREGRLEWPFQRGSIGWAPCCIVPAGLQADDFLFSQELRVGAVPVNERQVTKRWRLHVKKKLDIEADFYSLKHKNSTEIVSTVVGRLNEGAKAAADRNSHKSSTMVNKTYDVDRAAREHMALKELDIRLN